MRTFQCERCGQTVFFENTRCEACGASLGFDPLNLTMRAFEVDEAGVWTHLGSPAGAWQPCHNYSTHSACNWMVAETEGSALCVSCRHTHVIPDLSRLDSLMLWARMEAAKRRLFYTLLALKLPIPSRAEAPENGLVFHFKEQLSPNEPVMTGHAAGLITVNLAEADDVIREATRRQMGEPYRTLLGHFRHEIGHFYWDQLIPGSDWEEPVTTAFGDARQHYAEALKRHYEQGPPDDWATRYISSYAASHPWEDWAETWAHYLHISDALDTAAHWHVGFLAAQGEHSPAPEVLPGQERTRSFRRRLTVEWMPLARFLNSMGRSLGQGDLYPFTMPDPVLDKLCLVHEIVTKRVQGDAPPDT